MKRLIRFAAKMYPHAWRERYGEEFEALLDDAGTDVRIALDVFCGAIVMQIQRWWKAGSVALFAMTAIGAASRWIGQRPYITPGTHQVFHMDSNPGALAGLLVLVATTIAGLAALALCINDRKFREAARASWICAGIFIPYLAAVVLVSLLTPRTIVSTGDSYCWDLWCMGIQQVNAIPRGQNTLYTAEVRIFSDSNNTHRVPAERAKAFFHVLDEQGRRFPLLWEVSFLGADVNVKPGQSVKSSLTFLAPTNARKLYLIGGDTGPSWVNLYFGSDIALFHRPTLLRVL
jgi:hypothetical protein